MDKVELEKRIEELEEKEAEKEEKQRKIKIFVQLIILALISIGMPLTFCLLGIYGNDENGMLLAGIILFSFMVFICSVLSLLANIPP